MSFDVSPWFSEHFLAFLIHKMLQAHLVLFLDSVIFPRSPGFFWWTMVIETKIWTLGVRTAVGVPLTLGLAMDRAGRHMCVYAHSHLHFFLSLYIPKAMSTHQHPQIVLGVQGQGVHPAVLPFIISNSPAGAQNSCARGFPRAQAIGDP